ncbi:thiomuracin/GE37468 family thiazolyl RiPP peptide, partial [Nocardia sp. NPDC058497]|uniref:thiomuracin/GE37468 family thiazolyl RiPP peptide n=1 Tax=Nocardia sp. NPDC058497 TaxID=3346529 RepID=UPI003661D04C
MAMSAHGANSDDFRRSFEQLPMEVFQLDGGALPIESLTDGHGMTEAGASCTSCVC